MADPCLSSVVCPHKEVTKNLKQNPLEKLKGKEEKKREESYLAEAYFYMHIIYSSHPL